MCTKKQLTMALITLAGFCAAASAGPVTMRFEGVVASGAVATPSTPYSEAGYTLTFSLALESTEGIVSGAFPGINTNGSDIFSWCAGCGAQTITLTRTAGGAFDFLGFDTAVLQLESDQNVIDVIGTLSGGGTVTTTITQDNIWASWELDYSDVTSVEFAFGPGHMDVPDHAFDNLRMQLIPEPGSLALLGLGLAALRVRRPKSRRRFL